MNIFYYRDHSLFLFNWTFTIVHLITVENNHNENKLRVVFNNTKETQGNREVTKYIISYNDSVSYKENAVIYKEVTN
jgi:hypothetical protein